MSSKFIKKRKNNEEDISYWQSFSDLMSSMLIIFLLLFVYKIYDYNKEIYNYKADLEATNKKIEELTSVRGVIIQRLLNEFGENLEVDQVTGAIKLRSEILFDTNQSVLKDEGKDFLEKFIPKYLKVLLEDKEIKENISRIIIEGHTDDDGEYIYNLKLSQQRAINVAEFILKDPQNSIYISDIEQMLAAMGRSEADLITQNGLINKDESRRVEFKFQLRDEETIREILDEVQEKLDK